MGGESKGGQGNFDIFGEDMLRCNLKQTKITHIRALGY